MTKSESEAQAWLDANITDKYVDTTKLTADEKEKLVELGNKKARKYGVEIADSKYGKGLFAVKELKAGGKIPYDGLTVPAEIADALPNVYDKIVDSKVVGDVMKRKSPNIAAYANDPGKHGVPNAELQLLNDEKIYLVFLRNIEPKEEITAKYGDAYWEGDEQYHSSK